MLKIDDGLEGRQSAWLILTCSASIRSKVCAPVALLGCRELAGCQRWGLGDQKRIAERRPKRAVSLCLTVRPDNLGPAGFTVNYHSLSGTGSTKEGSMRYGDDC